MTLAYTRYFEELTSSVEETKRLIESANTADRPAFSARLAGAQERIDSEVPLRLAFVGEFGSGKSSLLSALTGADVLIDADVSTTASSEHSWHGLTLVDTPGVQAEGSQETDHDRIAREAAIGADLVLFVVTNELINPRLARHLRFILDDGGLGLAKKTALIVNKIDRETNPEHVLLGELQKVLGPHQGVPVYFCAASKLLEAAGAPQDLRNRFVAQSRMSQLTDSIDRFVDDAGALGRLATPLQIVADIIEGLQSSLVGSDDDKKQLELIRRQRAVLQRLQRRLLDVRKTWKQRAYSAILSQANSAVEQIDEVTMGEDLDAFFRSGMKQAVAEVEQLYDGVEHDIADAMAEAQRELNDIGQSPLAQDVDRIAAQRARRMDVGFKEPKPGEGTVAAQLGKAAVKPIQKGLDAAAKNAGGLRDAVYVAGKALGKKFRPWEAMKAGEKLAKVAGRVGKAVPYLALALDFYIQYREEKVKEEKARYLASMRLSLRDAFADQAQVEADALERAVGKVSQGPVSEALERLDASARGLAAAGSAKETLARDVAAVRERCTHLRTQLMSGAEEQPATS